MSADDALRLALRSHVNDDYAAGVEMVRERHAEKAAYLDRVVGLRGTSEYVERWMPDLLDQTRGSRALLDVGPGCGHWMEIMRAAGHKVCGIDCRPYSRLVQGYRAMCTALGLTVLYIGFECVIEQVEAGDVPTDRYDVIHSRASLGGVLGCRFGAKDTSPGRVTAFLDTCGALLNPRGFVQIEHNVWSGMDEMI